MIPPDGTVPYGVDLRPWIIIIILWLLIYAYFATVRGCGVLSTWNPTIHEYCECDGKVYGPMGFNCFSCDNVCATIKNYTVNEI